MVESKDELVAFRQDQNEGLEQGERGLSDYSWEMSIGNLLHLSQYEG